jgi:hypothetical protein
MGSRWNAAQWVVPRRPLSSPRGAADQRARAHREHASRAFRLTAYPAENVFVVHQGILPEPAGHVEEIELRRVGERHPA